MPIGAVDRTLEAPREVRVDRSVQQQVLSRPGRSPPRAKRCTGRQHPSMS